MVKPIKKSGVKKFIDRLERIDLIRIDDKDLWSFISTGLTGYVIRTAKKVKGSKIYRGRCCEKPIDISEIQYPPSKYVKSRGRANDIGQPVFYGASQFSVPFFELRISVGDKVAMSTWLVKEDISLNHIGFSEVIEQNLGSDRSLASIHKFVCDTRNFSEANLLLNQYLSYKFSIPISKENEQANYKLTCNLAKFLYGLQDKDIPSGLIYPTNQMKGNAENIVLKPHAVENFLQIQKVDYVEVTNIINGKIKCKLLDSTEEFKDTIIIWNK